MLDGYREAADRAPLLVVPTFADVVRYRGELADDGLVFGTAVVRFGRLASRDGAARGRPRAVRVAPAARARRGRRDRRCTARRAAPLRCDGRVPGRARAPRERARAGARRPGAVHAALCGPGRRAASRAAYAEELAALYSGYRRALQDAGRWDEDLRLAATIDALREDPARWGATPGLPLRLRRPAPAAARGASPCSPPSGAEVVVSLTFEAGRYAFAGRTETVEALRPIADRVVELPAIADHYASPSAAPPGAAAVRAAGGRRAVRRRRARPGRRDQLHGGRRGARGARARRRRGRAAHRRGGHGSRGDRGRRARRRAPSRRRCVACSPRPACRSRSSAAWSSGTRRSAPGSSRCCAARCWTAPRRTC